MVGCGGCVWTTPWDLWREGAPTRRSMPWIPHQVLWEGTPVKRSWFIAGRTPSEGSLPRLLRQGSWGTLWKGDGLLRRLCVGYPVGPLAGRRSNSTIDAMDSPPGDLGGDPHENVSVYCGFCTDTFIRV